MLAVHEHEWIRVSRWELDQGMVNYPAVRNHIMADVVRDARVRVLYVCGADHAKKCGLFARSWAVVVGRPGYTVTPEQRAGAALFIPCEDNAEDVSSTLIRCALQENRLEDVEPLLHPRVYARLKELGPQVLAP